MNIYDKIADPIAAATQLGRALFRSGMMPGLLTEEAGTIVAFECLCRQITIQSFVETYHVMNGKLSKKADAMLAEFVARGGTYTILDRTPEVCRIQFEASDNRKYLSTCSHDDVRNESFYMRGDRRTGQSKVSDNYATPRRRMQALSARCVSDGVRVVDPAVCAGLYTPEEMEDMQTEDRPTRDEAPAFDPDSMLSKPAEIIPLAEPTEEPIATLPEVVSLFSLMEIAYGEQADAKLAAALKKRKLTSIEQLSQKQIEELIDKVNQIIEERSPKN